VLLSTVFVLESIGSILLIFFMMKWPNKLIQIYSVILTIVVVLCSFGFMLNKKTYLILLFEILLNIMFVLTMIFGASLFPTFMRARALGISATCGRIGGILMPLIMYFIVAFDSKCYLVYVILIAGVSLLSVLYFAKSLKYPD